MNISINKYFFILQQIYGWAWYAFSFHETSKTKQIKYNWLTRLLRIYKFLQRSKKKRKQERRDFKKKKKDEKKKQKQFIRKKRWRKFKVVLRSLFHKKNRTPKSIALAKRAKFLKSWKKRKRRRVFKVILKGLGKRRKISPYRKSQIEAAHNEEAFNKYRKRRLYRYVLKRNIQIIGDFLKGKGLPARKRKKGPSAFKQMWYPKQLAITANSLMFFLLSYFFIAFFDKLSMGVASLLFEYKSVVYYYGIEFLVDYDDWFADSIKTIFAAGPVIGLLIALLSLIIYSIIYLENGILKTLLLWAIFHGINRIVMGTLVGSMIGKGFGYVIMYLYYSDTGKLIMSLIVITASVIAGTISTKYWIMSSNSYYNFSKPNTRTVFMLSQVFLPFVLGNIIIYLINMPKVLLYDTLVNVFMIFMILPPIILAKYQQELYFDESPKTIKVSVKVLLFSILFIGTYRILLDFGLRIG